MMKHHLVYILVASSLFFSCSSDDTDNNQQNQVNDAVVNIISVSEITRNDNLSHLLG